MDRGCDSVNRESSSPSRLPNYIKQIQKHSIASSPCEQRLGHYALIDTPRPISAKRKILSKHESLVYPELEAILFLTKRRALMSSRDPVTAGSVEHLSPRGQLYRLSDLERRLIVSWNLCADLSVREIAQRADVRQHQARHALMSLARRGIIIPMYLIDNYGLGFSDYGLFFSPSAESSELRRRFEQSLMRHPRVIWLARMSGSFQYGATFMAQRPHEVVDFFSWMQPLSQGAYAHKTTRIAIDCTWFSPNYLSPDITERTTVSVTSRVEPPKLDDTDKKILTTMTEHPASSTTQLASLTGMSKSSLAYRIDRMREAKIIRGRMYSIKNYILGIFMYRVMIVDCGLTAAQRAYMYEICSRCPNVVAYVVCTGNWDFELRFEAEHPEIVDNFCQQLIDTFGKAIGSVLVSQQLATLKRAAYAADVEQR